ncbi:hypothetical protein FLK61_41435 [Paenalkalicoccus suaedae]|uniref:Uncharacterized protein n=1 Tax=Paenalkalicoccus suaedae TaxID=2592382 RepID=A0A859FJU5_9BACI|nr:hypothetical protein [Paenalkalicoccus suaedae]QKS73056.1 hypothetical protein FLK61_41435 [Paenalkalicoccus suaedae]
MDKMYLCEEIKAVIRNLGGEAHLEEIFEHLVRRGNEELLEYKDPPAVVRKTIYMYASECQSFEGEAGDEHDVFCAVKGKKRGVWGLRKS